MKTRIFLMGLFCAVGLVVHAQIGEHRNELSVGVNGGYVLSSVGFDPSVSQNQHGGLTGGLSVKYTCEKYFNTICSVYAELNYASLGWTENIIDVNDAAVIDPETNQKQKYSRTVNYIQVPFFAHLAWGKEGHGLQFFVNAGPQFGYYLGESTSCNFNLADEMDRIANGTTERSNTVVAQDTMSIENKFDYGIAGGLGVEYTWPKVGHFLLEARYYYGLGNIYGDSKRDYFGKSNYGNIVVKLSWLVDLTRTSRKR